jgi:hypothetical protein
MKRRRIYRICGGIFIVVVLLSLFVVLMSRKDVPEQITYGMSFNVPYALEMGLDPDETLDALIEDLGIKDFRLAAHWTITEPEKDVYDFSYLDRHLTRIEEAGGTVVLGVGRRLPRWPECHVPRWAENYAWEEQQEEILEYITAVVERYKHRDVITYWQVENEPYLEVFAKEHCGEFDEVFLQKEVDHVRTLDPERPILVTDSGNLGTWNGPFREGDAFGTSVYVYFWNPELGQFKSMIPPWFYRFKENLMALLHGDKKTFLIELSLEPWLVEPVIDVPIETQFTRMNPDIFDEIILYARETRFEDQYLWGGEWWYWLKQQGYPEMWEKARVLFLTEKGSQ